MKIGSSLCAYFSVFLAIVWCVGSVSAADSISEAIESGKASGEMKIWYQTNDNDTNDNSIFHKENSVFDAGIRLGYTTDQYAGFGMSLNFYAVDDLWAHNNFANGSIQGMDQGEDFAWLGEAYLTFTTSDSLIKIGRQNVKSPLINSDEWALFPNNFMAYMFQNRGLPDTAVTFLYVTGERTRTQEAFDDVSEDGELIVGIANESIPNTALSGYYYLVNDDISDSHAVYLEAKTKISMIGLAGQYIFINPDTANQDPEETNAYGVMISTDLDVVSLLFAVTSVDDGATRAAKLSDSGTKTPLYTETLSGDGDIAGATDTDAYKVLVGYKPMKSLNLTASYAYYDHGVNSSAAADDESTSIEVAAKYSTSDKVSVFAAYMNTKHNSGAFQGANTDDHLNSIRVWAKYQF